MAYVLIPGGIVEAFIDMTEEDPILELQIMNGDDVKDEVIDMAPFSETSFQLDRMELSSEAYNMSLICDPTDEDTGLTRVTVTLDPALKPRKRKSRRRRHLTAA